MEEKGYLLFVLNTHLPYVRDPDIEYPQEENWLFEAITESYIPLIQVIQGLIEYGADFKMTFSFTPCLMAMLTDPLLL
jgi:1,4-alpha-glucan branching enzyme